MSTGSAFPTLLNKPEKYSLNLTSPDQANYDAYQANKATDIGNRYDLKRLVGDRYDAMYPKNLTIQSANDNNPIKESIRQTDYDKVDRTDPWHKVLGKSAMQGASATNLMLSTPIQVFEESMGLKSNIGKTATDYWRKDLANYTPVTTNKGTWNQYAKHYTGLALGSISRKLPGMAAGAAVTYATGNPVAGANTALGVMGAMTAGEKYPEMREKGFSVPESLITAGGYGAAEVIGEKMPLDNLFKQGMPFVKKVAAQMGLEIPGELLTETLEAAMDKNTIDPKMTLADFGNRLKDVLIVTPLATFGQTAVMHPVIERIGKNGRPEIDVNKLAEMVGMSEPSQPEGGEEVIVPKGTEVGMTNEQIGEAIQEAKGSDFTRQRKTKVVGHQIIPSTMDKVGGLRTVVEYVDDLVESKGGIENVTSQDIKAKAQEIAKGGVEVKFKPQDIKAIENELKMPTERAKTFASQMDQIVSKGKEVNAPVEEVVNAVADAMVEAKNTPLEAQKPTIVASPTPIAIDNKTIVDFIDEPSVPFGDRVNKAKYLYKDTHQKKLLISHINNFLNKYLKYTPTNPRIGKYGDKMYFAPHAEAMPRMKDRNRTLMEYALHFGTTDYEGSKSIRTIDTSKIDAMKYLDDIIDNPDGQYLTKNGKNYYKRIGKGNAVIILHLTPQGEIADVLRVSGFMPEKTNSYIEKAKNTPITNSAAIGSQDGSTPTETTSPSSNPTIPNPPENVKGKESGFISTEPITLDMLKERLKETKSDVKQSLKHLEEIGKKAWQEGNQSFAPWQLRMKTILGDMWNGFRQHMSNVFGRVKEWYKKSRISDQQGAIKFDNIKQGLKDASLKIRESLEDDWIRVKKNIELFKAKGGTLTDSINTYDVRKLMPGKVENKLGELKDTVNKIDKDILKTAKASKVTDKQLQADVNKYLIAKHAPERNAALGEKAAGISDQEAAKQLEDIKALPHAKEVERIAGTIAELNRKTLQILKDGQVIDQGLYDTLTKKYKNHVPLNRVFDESEDIGDVIATRGLDVKGPGIKKAVGSERQVSDILTNVTTNLASAIQRVEKNAVDLATINYAREYAKTVDKDLFEEVPWKAEYYNSPIVLHARENGKQVGLKINDIAMAKALKGVNKEQLPGLLRVMRAYNQFMSGLVTRFSPEFAFPNKIKDLQEAFIYGATQKEMGIKSTAKAIGKDVISIKAVLDGLIGNKTEGAKLYEQMKEDGVSTGGMAMSTRSQVETTLEKIQQLNRSNPRKALQLAADIVDGWNTIFEDSTRLSFYREALNKGLSRQQAAVIAKDASIDFNKQGTSGPVMNALWMFSKVSAQGSAKMLRAAKSNPKMFAALTGALMAAVYAINAWNDSADPEWEKKISKGARLSGLPIVIPTPTGITYITIPIGWGIKPIKVTADAIYDLTNGKSKNIGEKLADVLVASWDSYNPLGGTDIASSIMPSIGRLPQEIARNKKWTGGQIHPDYDQNLSAQNKYTSKFADTFAGKALIPATKALAETTGVKVSPMDVQYAVESLAGGPGQFTSKVISMFSKDEREGARIPFVSRFYKSKTEEQLGMMGSGVEEAKKALNVQADKRFEQKQETEKMFKKLQDKFKTIPKEEIADRLDKLAEVDPKLLKDFMEYTNKQNRPYAEVLIKQMGKDTTRPQYFIDMLKDAKDRDAKKKLLNEWMSSGLLDDEVLQNMSKIKTTAQ
jgi:hypothetical protein